MLFCLYWLRNYILFKLAYITDILLDFVFSSTNVEDHCNFENFAGTEKNINQILSTFGDADHEIVIFLNSHYITHWGTATIFQNDHNECIALNLNVESIHAKFNRLYPIVSKLSPMVLYFGAVCLQETWLASDTDSSLL